MAKNKVHWSWEAPGGHVCVDIFQRPDGSWGFEEYRREPEDAYGWYMIGHHGECRFPSAETAIGTAQDRVGWLSCVELPGSSDGE